MRITSKPFIVLLGLLTLALFGLTQILWRRLSGRGPAPVAGRVALLVGGQLAFVATLAAVANGAFGFYTSWSELFGAGSQTYHLVDRGVVPSAVNATQLSHPAGRAGAPAVTGSVVTETLVGLRSGIAARVRIYLPPRYFSHAGRHAGQHADFPAIVVDDSGQSSSGAQLAAALLTAHGTAHPAIVVIVDTADGVTLPCTNSPERGQGELFWGQDVRTAVAYTYQVSLDADAWGVTGTDADGDCAASLAIADSARFSAAAALGSWDISGANGVTPELGDATSPAAWLRTYHTPPVRLLLNDQGGSVDQELGCTVRPPLQVQSAANLTETAALDWLSAALTTNGVRA